MSERAPSRSPAPCALPGSPRGTGLFWDGRSPRVHLVPQTKLTPLSWQG